MGAAIKRGGGCHWSRTAAHLFLEPLRQSSYFLPLEPFSPEAGPSRTRSSQRLPPAHWMLLGPRNHLQGYLAHKKTPTPEDHIRALGIGLL